MRVLIVEPDRILAELYRQALAGEGYDISVAATAQAAVFAADAHRPDVVLLEMQLVGHSGIEFMYELRSYTEWQHIPVVVLSNVPPVEFAGSRQLLEEELNIQTYHYKPQLSLKELIKSVQQLLPNQTVRMSQPSGAEVLV